MEFRVLGPFEVVDEELEVVPLGAAKERALLALLVLHADEVVSSERMIDASGASGRPSRPRTSFTRTSRTCAARSNRDGAAAWTG